MTLPFGFTPTVGAHVKNNSINCPNKNCMESSLSLQWHLDYSTNEKNEVRCFQCNQIIGICGVWNE